MDRSAIIKQLPPYQGKTVTIARNQEVDDIVNEILNAHDAFASHYDKIFLRFDGNNVLDIANNLFTFCKKNIAYKIESEASQTTKSPAAILFCGKGDCKHYALFIGGVLDAFKRAGDNINWFYRFASYNPFDKTPQHVFVVVKQNGKELWIDPVLPTLNNRKPFTSHLDRKPMLSRIHGVGKFAPQPGDLGFEFAPLNECNNVQPTKEQLNAIELLFKYGVMDKDGGIDINRLYELQSDKFYPQLVAAYNFINGAAISGFFDAIWRGVKKVTLAAPRNAYLSLVALNAFGYATKLKAYVWQDNGDYNLPHKEKLKSLWQDKLGGDWTNLQNTIIRGAKKKRLGGVNVIGVAAAIPAWVATASAIIAAITPLLKEILHPAAETPAYDASEIDPNTGLPYGMTAQDAGVTTGSNNNLLLMGGIGLAAVLLLTRPTQKEK